MKIKFTLFLISTFSGLFSATAQTTYVDNGTSATYTLQTGDSLYISKGIFTGTINDWAQGGKVTIASGATFKPANVNGYRSKYTIYGTATVSSLNTEAGFGLKNYGTLTVTGGSQVNGNAAQVWINYGTGTIAFKSSFAINADGTSFTNYGDVNVASDFNLYSTSTIVNKKNLSITGNFNSSKGQVGNEGLFASQKITFGGNTSFTNTCRTIAENGITIDNSSATVYNSGLLWASNNKSSSSFTNSGTIISTGNGIIKTVTFINYNIIRGNGLMYITGKSTLGSQGKVGVSGNTADTLKIYTVNRTKTTQIFDDQWGTVYSNAVYAKFQAPDTTTASDYPCSAEYAPLIILPVTWNDFSVELFNDLPVLNWSAKFDEGTLFEVQRSFDGNQFSAIAKVNTIQGISAYRYNDQSVPASHGNIIYYRIKAFEPSGLEKYTAIKSIRFATESAVSLQAAPNPFTGQLNINYKAARKGTATIKIFNIEGQLQLVKNVQVSIGNNTITIPEGNNFKSGIYILNLNNENGTIISAKVIKQ